MGSGTTIQAVNAVLSGLSPGTPFYFRVVASNGAGTAKGSIVGFSTTAAAPTVTTNAATSVTGAGATVNGSVNPNGQETTAWFEWGTDPGLATFNSTSSQSMGSGTTVIPLSESISGFGSDNVYFFRAVASNNGGTRKGDIKSFATGAYYYVAVGDSITAGSHDDISTDGIGFEPILENLLTASKGVPVTTANEGVSGATSADGAATISSSLSKYPSARFYLVMYGSNDAYIPPVPSGMGLIPGDPGYDGSFKDNMQKIVSAILAVGKTPYLAEVLYTSDPLRSKAMIYEYNAVIDELFITNNILVTPPPFYKYFQTHQGELADGIHPNGTGYQSMADLWFTALTQ
jgi:lysophospholipase L1-like esterase